MKKGIVIGCVDPRLHGVLPQAAELMGVDKTYQFRAAGPDGVMRESALSTEKSGLLAGVLRLSKLAQIDAYAFIGHTDCAGHQVSDDEHRKHIRDAAEELKHKLDAGQPVHAILAVRGESDEDWMLELLETY